MGLFEEASDCVGHHFGSGRGLEMIAMMTMRAIALA
jgi:hypothetical protein